MFKYSRQLAWISWIFLLFGCCCFFFFSPGENNSQRETEKKISSISASNPKGRGIGPWLAFNYRVCFCQVHTAFQNMIMGCQVCPIIASLLLAFNTIAQLREQQDKKEQNNNLKMHSHPQRILLTQNYFSFAKSQNTFGSANIKVYSHMLQHLICYSGAKLTFCF